MLHIMLQTREGDYAWSNLMIIDADTIHPRICKQTIPELTDALLCYREKSINPFPVCVFCVFTLLILLDTYDKDKHSGKTNFIVNKTSDFRQLSIRFIVEIL